MTENLNFDYSYLSPQVAQTIYRPRRFNLSDSRNNEPFCKELIIDSSYIEKPPEGYIDIKHGRRAGFVPRLTMDSEKSGGDNGEPTTSQPSFSFSPSHASTHEQYLLCRIQKTRVEVTVGRKKIVFVAWE